MKLSDLKFLKVMVEKHPTRDLTLEFLDKPNAICSLLVNENMDKTLLVKQYRPGFKGSLLEAPAGIIDPGEDEYTALHRELLEETGYGRDDYEIIYSSNKPLMVSPGYTGEGLYMFIARLKDDSITPKELTLDSGEDITCHWVDVDIFSDECLDLKTLFVLEKLKSFK